MNYYGDDEDFGTRMDADILQANMAEQGRRFTRGYKAMKRLRAEGKLLEAATACPHGGGYPLDSLAAKNAGDPNAGEKGWRCCDCGSRLDSEPWNRDFAILVPCEIPLW